MWYSLDSVGANRNELEFGPDLVGTATIYFYYEDSLLRGFHSTTPAITSPNARERHGLSMIQGYPDDQAESLRPIV